MAVAVAFLVGCGGPPASQDGSNLRGSNSGRNRPAAQPKVPQADPIAASAASTIDLTAKGAYRKTWAIRVKECTLSTEGGVLTGKVVGGTDTSGGQYGGASIKVGPVKAVEMDVAFTNPQNVSAAFLDLTVGKDDKQRVRWDFVRRAGVRIPPGKRTYTFRPEKGSHGFVYEGGPGSMDEVSNAQFFIRVKPGTTAGFEIHRLVVEK